MSSIDPNQVSLESEAATPWRTKSEMATYYDVDIRTITNFMRRGVLPYVKIGRFVRFHIEKCDCAMEKFTHIAKR
jgi:hypothetical protein